MPRLWTWTALCAALLVAGCANPADDKFKVTATPPKPVEPEAIRPAELDQVTPAPGTLVIAPENTTIEFTGSKVTGSHHGGFKSFTGTAELATDQPEVRRITVAIDMDSTWTDNDHLTTHLKSADFFDVAQNPKAHFVTTEIKPVHGQGATHTITGNLTLHGVTKSISFPASITVTDGTLSLASEFAINRQDFGIAYPGKSDDLIRDEVVLKIDVKAPRKA